MKKWSFLLLACAATLLFMAGCGEQTASSGASGAAGQFRLYRVTVFAGAGFPAERKNPNPSPAVGKGSDFLFGAGEGGRTLTLSELVPKTSASAIPPLPQKAAFNYTNSGPKCQGGPAGRLAFGSKCDIVEPILQNRPKLE